MGHFLHIYVAITSTLTAMMKLVVLLALAAVAFAQTHRPHHGPGSWFNHGDPLHHLIHQEAVAILASNDVSVEHCATKCDAVFDLNAGHDEEITDKLCKLECQHQLHMTTPSTA